MLNIFLCEDNPKQRETYKKIIENIVLMENFDLEFSCVTESPRDIIHAMERTKGTGIYFLDIDLGCDMNGLQLAQQIRRKDTRGYIVFLTTHSEMAYMTFTYKVEAMDFIVKDDMGDIRDRIYQCIVNAYQKYTSPNNRSEKNFICKIGERERCIPLDEIFFFETSNHSRKIILHGKEQILEFTGKMKEVEAMLDERFYRVHRSYLVNREHIREIDRKERKVTMSNGEICFASLKQLRGLKISV